MKLTNIQATNTYPAGSEHDPQIIFSATVDPEDGSKPFDESVEVWQSHLDQKGVDEQKKIDFLVNELILKIKTRQKPIVVPFTEISI